MKAATLIIFTLLAAPASADVKQDLLNCAKIAEHISRLQCYDDLTKNVTKLEQEAATAKVQTPKQVETTKPAVVKETAQSAVPAATPASAVVATPKVTTPEVASPAVPAAAVSAPVVAAQPTKSEAYSVQDKEDMFGKKATEIHELDSIESRVVGSFRGWKKGAIIELENGQKWRVISGRGVVRLENPKATVERGLFSSFRMKVEGLNAAAKVKRIQ